MMSARAREQIEDTVARRTLSDHDRNELRKSLVGGYGVAAVTSLAVTLPSGSDHANLGLMILAGLEIIVALFLALVPSMSANAVKFFAFPLAIACVSAACAVANPIGPTALYYLWPALTCGHYGNRRDARMTLLMMMFGFAIAIIVGHEVQVPVITYLCVVTVFLFVLVGYQRSRAESLRLTAELAHSASTDALTDLLNRRAFGEAFGREVETARETHTPLSVIMFDLDHFKHLNDSLGHAAGDDALIAFADILREVCEDRTELLGRMGGEEFAVVLSDADAAGAQATADEIATKLADWSRGRPSAMVSGPLTTSAGIATMSPVCATTSELLVTADRALYAAKQAGRNRVVRAGENAPHVLAKVA
jgi:diguanylate cyclase (GGDEF)-like protein